jgi:methylmalonyl-CoA mutase cobalamin-binding domain/chain
MSSEIVQMLADLDEEGVLTQVKQDLEAGADPLAIFEACRQGMVEIGKKYEDKQYFVADLMMAGEIFKQASALLSPSMQGKTAETKAEVVVGTVQGDIHDIGKDLVVALLRADGFEVHDLGVDVPPDQFAAKIKETGAKVIGLSGLITTAYDGMRDTVAALEAAGIRDQVTVVIGGGLVNDEVQKYAGADAWGKDANQAVTLFNKYLGGE